MFKTGNVYIKPKLRKSSQRYYPKNVKMTFGKGFEGHTLEFNKPSEMTVDIKVETF